MTEEQYKKLQHWCQKNKKHVLYSNIVALRNRATCIRRDICNYKMYIKSTMFVLEACKEDAAIKKWKDKIEQLKVCRDNLMNDFKQLTFPEFIN